MIEVMYRIRNKTTGLYFNGQIHAHNNIDPVTKKRIKNSKWSPKGKLMSHRSAILNFNWLTTDTDGEWVKALKQFEPTELELIEFKFEG